MEVSSSDAHRKYSALLTHRPRNRTDTDRGTEQGGVGGSNKNQHCARVQSSTGDVSAMKFNCEKSLRSSCEFGCG